MLEFQPNARAQRLLRGNEPPQERLVSVAHTAELLDTVLADLGEQGEVDVVPAIASRLPPAVFCWMVGCDVERGPELRHWSSIALRAFSGDPSVMQDVAVAIRALRRFADELIEQKQRTPGSDLTSALLEAVTRRELALDDVRSLLTELLSASVDNTTHSMGLALWLLGRHPDEWSAVARGLAPVDRAVEECARFEPVIRHGNHVATRDLELLGVEVPEGTLVTVYLASAHRDPAAYDAPDLFSVVRRPAHPQLQFGIGRHHCIGAALARMEIQEVVGAVVTRWAAPSIGPGARVETAVTGEVHSLPVEFEARALG